MKIKVVKKEESKLFPRVDAYFEVEYAGKTPSRQELVSEIAKTLGRDEKLVVVRKILSKYGEQICSVEASIYVDEKSLKEIEKDYILKRNGKFGKNNKTSEDGESEKDAAKNEEKGEQ